MEGKTYLISLYISCKLHKLLHTSWKSLEMQVTLFEEYTKFLASLSVKQDKSSTIVKQLIKNQAIYRQSR